MRVRRRSQGREEHHSGREERSGSRVSRILREGRFSVPDRLKSRLVPIKAETINKSLGIDTLYEQQSSAQSSPGDIAAGAYSREL
jgi:hypothetical protein